MYWTFILLKIFFIAAIFSKAWLDVKCNKNQVDHIVTAVFEAVLVLAVYMAIEYQIVFISGSNFAGTVLSYILLRAGLFDLIRNKLSGMPAYHFGSNNWLDLKKEELYNWGMNRKRPIPVYQLLEGLALFFGIFL